MLAPIDKALVALRNVQYVMLARYIAERTPETFKTALSKLVPYMKSDDTDKENPVCLYCKQDARVCDCCPFCQGPTCVPNVEHTQ